MNMAEEERDSGMLKAVLKTIREHSLFREGDTLVVAVSGGADSVALLDLLASLGSWRLRLVVAHLNHCLRGAESEADAEFVRELAGRYGLPVELGAVDVKELSRRERLSLEEAGRVARYAFLDEVAARHRASAVVLAHHADDQAETVLMRLIRGAAGSGLCAMSPGSAGGHYVRPLLACNREEIEAYLSARRIAWRNDSSNADVNFLRNRIRHELLPLLASYNPCIVDRLTATASVLAGDEAVLADLTDRTFARHASIRGGAVSLVLSGVQREAKGLRLRLYRHAISKVKGDLARIAHRHLEAIDRLILAGRPQLCLDLPDGVKVERSYGELVFSAADSAEKSVPYEFLVEGPGVYPLPAGGRLVVEVAEPPADWRTVPATTVFFDLEAAQLPWLVRTFRPGDRFMPFGMRGSKKVKELFVDLKVPRRTRQRIPLLFSGERLIWVAGVRSAEVGRLTGHSRRVMRVEIADFTP